MRHKDQRGIRKLVRHARRLAKFMRQLYKTQDAKAEITCRKDRNA
jgi:hypothetical protein